MLASIFGSVSSSLRRTSANDRCDEIFTCSTAMPCDAKIACAVVSVMCALHVMACVGLEHSRGWSSTPQLLELLPRVFQDALGMSGEAIVVVIVRLVHRLSDALAAPRRFMRPPERVPDCRLRPPRTRPPRRVAVRSVRSDSRRRYPERTGGTQRRQP